MTFPKRCKDFRAIHFIAIFTRTFHPSCQELHLAHFLFFILRFRFRSRAARAAHPPHRRSYSLVDQKPEHDDDHEGDDLHLKQRVSHVYVEDVEACGEEGHEVADDDVEDEPQWIGLLDAVAGHDEPADQHQRQDQEECHAHDDSLGHHQVRGVGLEAHMLVVHPAEWHVQLAQRQQRREREDEGDCQSDADQGHRDLLAEPRGLIAAPPETGDALYAHQVQAVDQGDLQEPEHDKHHHTSTMAAGRDEVGWVHLADAGVDEVPDGIDEEGEHNHQLAPLAGVSAQLPDAQTYDDVGDTEPQ